MAGPLVRALLLPLSALWWLATALRNRHADATDATVVPGVRVISVGNLAVGGTGKTPIASWLTRGLLADGVRTAIALRGYGRDEAALHRIWTPDVSVLVGPDRAALARRAAADGARAVVLDDGFQHRRLARSLDVVVLSVEDPFPGLLLPAGPYREPAGSLARASAVVLSRRSAGVDEARALAARVEAVEGVATGAVVASVRLAPNRLRSLDGWATGRLEGDEPSVVLDRPLALTAIARPDSFRHDLAAFSRGAIDLAAFPDHHDFSARDVRAARAKAPGRPLVVTEKDAVKLAEFTPPHTDAWVLEQELVWDWGDDALGALVREALR